jgi:TRAP-type C4-dicarboxylate transport system permease small subunit
MLARPHAVALATASLAVLVMALVGGIDVISATALDRPIPGVYEATELLMVAITVLAMSSLQARGRNIAVDVISARLPLATQRSISLLSNLLGLIFFGLIAWQGWLLAWESMRVQEYAQGAVQIPVFPSKIAFAIGMSLLVLEYMKDLLAWKKGAVAPAQQEVAKQIRI